MARTSPTQRTLKWLRDEGYKCCVVERWIERAKKRVDAFGFGDILFMKPDEDPWFRDIGLAQTTSGTNHAAHKAKILAEPLALDWLQSGGLILLISWRKLRVKGTPKLRRWEPRVEWITEEDFDEQSDQSEGA